MAVPFLLCCWIPPDSLLSHRRQFFAENAVHLVNGYVIFLRNFMKGRRTKVFLVVDGHPAHKATIVKNYLTETQGRLELYFLPPYAPDLNPDEFVWNYMKNTGVSKKPLKKNESLRERVEQDLANISLDAILVASFFLAPSVVYTAD